MTTVAANRSGRARPRDDHNGGLVPDVPELDLRARVREILNRRPAVGLAVGILRAGRLEFHGHGFADLASKQPVTEDTVFRIASITKLFTATAVMQVAEEGLVDLDAPASDYLTGQTIVVDGGFLIA